MKRVLIVSPHFPPVNAPDMQRVRLALPLLRAHGWEPTVLAIAPDSIEGAVIEPALDRTYPADVRVIRVRGLPARLTRWAGIGNLWWRCGRALTRAGDALLHAEKFDLVFLSTTQFAAFQLGPRWRRRFGVPYVLDYQDPWINPYYGRTGARPPGGKLKFALSQWSARRIEPAALRQAAGIVAVSGAYGPMLAESYPWFDAGRVKLLPFGAASSDLAIAGTIRPDRPLIDFEDGRFHHVYTGRCGPDMAFALRVLFRAFKLHLDACPADAERIRFHFIGTDYAPPPLGREWARPIAEEEGVGRFVDEHCGRVPYFDALHYLRRAQAVVAVGSDDPTYAASKIFPCILARRPLLLIYHEKSLVLQLARRVSAGECFAFREAGELDTLARAVCDGWFAGERRHREATFDEAAFQPFTSAAMTAELAAVFDRAAATAAAPSA